MQQQSVFLNTPPARLVTVALPPSFPPEASGQPTSVNKEERLIILMTSFLSVLSDDVCLLLLHVWLDMKDLTFLDSAHCLSAIRPSFLKLLASPYFGHGQLVMELMSTLKNIR